jgi:VanZ family protein
MLRTQFAIASFWLVLVLFLGSAYFAAQETGRYVLPFLKFLMPGVPSSELQAIHMVLRKLAHVLEYAVLALLWYRALHTVGGRIPRTAAWVALSICLVCSFADEAHQSMLRLATAASVISSSTPSARPRCSRSRGEGPWATPADA